jgi:hypothetical protein
VGTGGENHRFRPHRGTGGQPRPRASRVLVNANHRVNKHFDTALLEDREESGNQGTVVNLTITGDECPSSDRWAEPRLTPTNLVGVEFLDRESKRVLEVHKPSEFGTVGASVSHQQRACSLEANPKARRLLETSGETLPSTRAGAQQVDQALFPKMGLGDWGQHSRSGPGGAPSG